MVPSALEFKEFEESLVFKKGFKANGGEIAYPACGWQMARRLEPCKPSGEGAALRESWVERVRSHRQLDRGAIDRNGSV